MTQWHIARLKALGVDENLIKRIQPCCCKDGDIEIHLQVLSAEWFVSCSCGMTGPSSNDAIGSVLGWNDFISTFGERANG